jgi:anti-sigma regulatory factor (Ser/Thr protein kinase)
VFALDTHVHTCLSPCAELEMHPSAVAAAARRVGLDGLVVCDHNAAGNAGAVMRAGRRAGLWVVPGMEITTAEEAHVEALLPDEAAALELQGRVQASLPGRNDPSFGLQVVADEHETVLGYDEHLLSGATTWTLEETVDRIHAAGGLAVAAHVDREAFGIVGQLGMIPPDLPLDALEVSARLPLGRARRTLASRATAFLCSSDAHRPEDVGRGVSFLLLEEPTFSELRRALGEREGRSVLGGGRPMEDLSLHILDIAQNAVEAGARSIEIGLSEDPAADALVIEVRDDGRGMSPEAAQQALDPFFTTRTTRRVGLGLALLAQAARATGGDVRVESEPGRGTRVRATFGRGHVDRQPLGDVESTLMVLIAGNPGVEVRFRHQAGDLAWSLDSRRLEGEVGDRLASPRGLQALRQVIREGESRLDQGVGGPAGRPAGRGD